MKEQINIANDFIDFIAKSPTKYHAIDNVKSKLLEHKFEMLSMDEKWNLKPGGRYFIEQDDSALIAFCMSFHNLQKLITLEDGIRLVCAHTDSPAFKVKPIAQMTSPDGYIRLNTQGYAWPILSTWFDRPLSLAGRIALKGKHPFKPIMRLVDIEDSILIIPNVAFHLTKGKTEGGISKQKEMLPIMGMTNKNVNTNEFFDRIANKLNIAKETILDYELYLYPVDRGRLVGMNSDFIVTPRQDDLVMVYAALEALTGVNSTLSEIERSTVGDDIELAEANIDDATRMIAFFDAEEETNSTLGGADSPLLRNVITKMIKSVGGDEEDLIKLINHSFAVSLDTSFAAHPNYMECSDPTCSPVMNKGVVIKYDANMHYATTAFSSAVFQEVCRRGNIPYQKAAANSDLRTGGTISAFMQTQVEMKCVEVGIPTWAMHSAYESCGTTDLFNLICSLKNFWMIRDRNPLPPDVGLTNEDL